jgi:hypothetical protein
MFRKGEKRKSKRGARASCPPCSASPLDISSSFSTPLPLRVFALPPQIARRTHLKTRHLTRRPAISNPKSTPCYPKSTLDLGLEPLIWGKNTLKTLRLSCRRHHFSPITAREWSCQNQIKTETNQKMRLGIEALRKATEGYGSPLGGRYRDHLWKTPSLCALCGSVAKTSA